MSLLPQGPTNPNPMKFQDPTAVLNPVDGFLKWMQDHQSELKSKIDGISAENNGPLPVFTMNPMDIDKWAGDQMSWMWTTQDQWIKAPIDAPIVDETQSMMYKALAPLEGFAKAGQEITKDFSKNLQWIGHDISNVSNELWNMIQNKAPGIEQAKREGRYMTKDQVKDFISKNPKLTKAQIAKTMSNLASQGYFFEWFNDLNDKEWWTSIWGDLLGAAVKWVWWMFWAWSEALWWAMEWTQNIAEWDTALWASQLVKAAPKAVIAWTSALFPGASLLGWTALSTDSWQAVMEPVMDVSSAVTKFGTDNLLPTDTRPEVRANIEEWVSNLLPMAATYWAWKWLQKTAPYVKEAAGKAWEFISENAPKVSDAMWKAGETIKDTATNVSSKVGEKVQATRDAATDFFDKTVGWVDKSKKAGYQSNPYTKEYADELVRQMDSPEGVNDIKQTTANMQDNLFGKLSEEIAKKEELLGENGKAYQTVRELPTQVPVKDIVDQFHNTLNEYGLWMDHEGKIFRVPWTKAGEINQADISKLNTLYDDIVADGQRGNWNLNVNQVLDARKSASAMAKYDATTTTRGNEVMQAFRRNIDKTAKERITGLKDIDSKFVDRLQEYKEATKDLVYKNWSDKWEFRSNVVNILKNINNPSRKLLKERLEEVMPDLATRMEAINQLPGLYEAFTKQHIKWKFIWWISWFGSWSAYWAFTGGPLWFIVWGILWALTGIIAEWGITKAKANRIHQIVSNTSAEGLKKLNEINEKIKNNKELTQKEQEFMDQKVKEVEAEIVKEKYVDPTIKQPLLPQVSSTPKSVLNEKWEVASNPDGAIPLKEKSMTDSEIIEQSKPKWLLPQIPEKLSTKDQASVDKKVSFNKDWSIDYLDENFKKKANRLEWIADKYITEANRKNLKSLVEEFDSPSGRIYNEIQIENLKRQYPENFDKDGNITLYRWWEIREWPMSFSISKKNAEWYSQWGFGSESAKNWSRGKLTEVKINPKDAIAYIDGWEEIIVDNSYIRIN